MVTPISWTTRFFTELNKTTSSLVPVAIKDSADITGRTVMAKKEGGEHEARERFIEETSTSLVWLGGIPLSRWLFDKAIIHPMKFDSKTNLELLDSKKNKHQNIGSRLESIKNVEFKDAKLNGLYDKLKKANESKLFKNVNKYKALQVVKAIITTAIPMVLLSHTLVKMNFEITDRRKRKELEEKYKNNVAMSQNQTPPKSLNQKNVSFSGMKDFMVENFSPVALATSATNNPLANMGALDFAISSGRIVNARNTNEKIEYGIKEGGIIFFIYMGGKIIQNALEYCAKKIFDVNLKLCPSLLEDKKQGGFIEKIKEMQFNPSKKAEWMIFDNKNEEETLNIINKHLKNENKEFANGEFVNPVLKAAQKTGIIKLLETKEGKFILDPRRYIDTNEIKKLNNDIVSFSENAAKHSSSIDKFFDKAKKFKRISLLANLIICNLAVGYAVPKLQYIVREKRTGTKMAPGHEKYAQMERELQQKQASQQKIKLSA